jgi:hypothetical protein
MKRHIKKRLDKVKLFAEVAYIFAKIIAVFI